jgi:hypothetical protein
MHEMVDPHGLCIPGFGNAKHDFPSFLMPFKRNAFRTTSLLKTMHVAAVTKHEHPVSVVPWMAVMVDPTHESVGLQRGLQLMLTHFLT